MLTRRQFLRSGAVAAGGILAGGSVVTLGQSLLTASRGSGGIIPTLSRYDEEFNAPLSDLWQTLASSTGTFDVNATAAGGLYMVGDPDGTGGIGIYKPIPAIPFTVTAFISAMVNDASDVCDAGLMLGEATPGAFIHGCWDVAFPGDFVILGSYWSSPTVWVQNISTNSFDPGATAIPHYSRFVVNSQDDVDGFYSTDGENWTQWLDAYNPPFTIGSVGLDFHNWNPAHSMTVDWLRFT